MKIQIKVYVRTNRQGSDVEDVIDVEVDKNDSGLHIEVKKEEAAREWIFDNIEWGYTDEE